MADAAAAPFLALPSFQVVFCRRVGGYLPRGLRGVLRSLGGARNAAFGVHHLRARKFMAAGVCAFFQSTDADAVFHLGVRPAADGASVTLMLADFLCGVPTTRPCTRASLCAGRSLAARCTPNANDHTSPARPRACSRDTSGWVRRAFAFGAGGTSEREDGRCRTRSISLCLRVSCSGWQQRYSAGTCAPAGHAVLIMSSATHAPLLETFGAGLRAGNVTCFLPVLLIACLDEVCTAACASALPGARCVLAQPCDAREQATFFALTAHRYAVYASALEVLPHRGGLLALDDDLLLLKPPFVFSLHKYDVRHQVEAGSGCGATVNTGILFMQRTNATARLLRRMLDLAPLFGSPAPDGRKQLDQDLFAAAAVDVGATRCALPKSAFAGHCSGMKRRTMRLKDLVTYHATCSGDKASLLRGLAAARAEPTCADAPLRGIRHVGNETVCKPPTWRDSIAQAALRIIDNPKESATQNMTSTTARLRVML